MMGGGGFSALDDTSEVCPLSLLRSWAAFQEVTPASTGQAEKTERDGARSTENQLGIPVSGPEDRAGRKEKT